MDKKVVKTLCEMPEHYKNLRGLTAWVGYKQDFVEFVRTPRSAGKSRYNYRSLFRMAFTTLVSYTTFPLVLALKGGIFLFVLSLLGFGTLGALLGFGIAFPFVSWLFPTVAFFTSLVMITIGLQNIYFSRIFEESRNRPQFIVSSTLNID